MDRVAAPMICTRHTAWLCAVWLAACVSSEGELRAPPAPWSQAAVATTGAGAAGSQSVVTQSPPALEPEPEYTPKPKPESGPAPPSRDPNLDFTWEQHHPGTPDSHCRAGVYTGSFHCIFVPDGSPAGSILGVLGLTLSGPVTILLEQMPRGEFLTIANGDFAAVAQERFDLRAKLRGDLDCRTRELNATTEGGTWVIGDPAILFGPRGTFGAELHGALDADSGGLTGVWSFSTGTLPGTCIGEWSAASAP